MSDQADPASKRIRDKHPYSLELAEEICSRLMSGDSLRAICRDEERMPHIATVMVWTLQNDEFAKMYDRARKVQAEVMFDEMLYLADTPNIGVKRKTKDGKQETTLGDNVERSKAQIDVRKWILARMDRKRWGDHTQTEITGGVATTLKVVGGLPEPDPDPELPADPPPEDPEKPKVE